MKKLLNTLFVTSEDAYLTLDGENVVVNREKQVTARFPLHALAGIISFSYAGASPALMGACAKRDVCLSFCTPRGRFLARTCGVSNGNVLLRRTQYRTADDPPQACRIARMMVFGKIYNARWSIERTCRDHAMRVDTETLKAASAKLKALLEDTNIDEARILTEAAIFADKTAVDEETVRLRSHIRQYRDILEKNEPVGRKLDFLTQELNRETNTIGSKAQELAITRMVVDMKAEIEKIREQIQNIE